MTIYNYYLVTRNARGKVQIVILELLQNGLTFTIKRTTGQHFGKMISQPDLTIVSGKAKRSALQQAELEFASNLKKYLDKGYKKLTDLTNKDFKTLTESELNNLVDETKTDQSGNIKPQLAKSSNDCTINIWKKPMWCSKKLDGVRCLMRFDELRNEVISISRGGENYDISTEHIRNIPELVEVLKANPGMILDGELYHHGKSLQSISGIARLKTRDERCNLLQYWIYDIADETRTFLERLELLEDLEDTFENIENIVICKHIELCGWADIKNYHDKWVLEGFEGLVARKPDKKYSPGKRPSDWIKVKEYKEDTFKIIDYSDGLRPEDFCFILETKDGKSFEAKPIGTKEEKAEYLKDIDNIIGRLGEVKFFNYSEKGIPTQTVFRAVRYDL